MVDAGQEQQGSVQGDPTARSGDVGASDAPSWKKPAIEGTFGGCLNCGPRPSYFPADGVIAVGFGSATLTKDNKLVYDEPTDPQSDDEYMTGAQAEAIAAADPDHDWRITLHGPLSGREYQRHGPEQWALIHQDLGFA